MAKLSQNQRVLNHLIDHGYITQIIASSYGIRRCASRITDLRDVGVAIEVDYPKDDAGVRYARYTLTDANRATENQSRANGRAWNNYDPVIDLLAA
jgi:hypothetical protein